MAGFKENTVLQGADWFESALVDYDVCSNWGNWVAAAGLTGVCMGCLLTASLCVQAKFSMCKQPELMNIFEWPFALAQEGGSTTSTLQSRAK